MRIPFLKNWLASPMDKIDEYNKKMTEAAWAFQQTMECYITPKCTDLEKHMTEAMKLVNEAYALKESVFDRPPVIKNVISHRYMLFIYILHQNKIFNAIVDTLNWISIKSENKISSELKKEFFLLIDEIVEAIEDLSKLASQSKVYFTQTNGKKLKKFIKNAKELTATLQGARNVADSLLQKIYVDQLQSSELFYQIRTVELIRQIVIHTQDSIELLRALTL